MLKVDQYKISKKESISVEFFYKTIKERFGLKLHSNDKGFKNKIIEQNLHRPGLALAGFVELFSFARVQVFGNTEMKYLANLSPEKRKESLERIFQFKIPCIIISNEHNPFSEIIELAEKYEVCVFGSKHSTTKLIYLIGDFLDDQFAPCMSIHGSLVDVYGVGILFAGKSGAGKSEVALDLIERGHRLVADDVVVLTKKGEGIIIGAGTDVAQHYMEIRGIGIVDVRSMFGIRAIRYQKRLEVIVELEIWDDKSEYTRTGLDNIHVTLMDVDIPYIKLPIIPGKNVTVIAEVIALNYLLKHYGYDPAKTLQERLAQRLESQKANRSVNYFEHDFE